jgi:hypothetical protein
MSHSLFDGLDAGAGVRLQEERDLGELGHVFLHMQTKKTLINISVTHDKSFNLFRIAYMYVIQERDLAERSREIHWHTDGRMFKPCQWWH